MNTQRVEGHTPLPWKFISHDHNPYSQWLGNIKGSYGLVDGIENICTISCQTKHEKFPGEARANAAFIVHACNNIERLEKVNEALVADLKFTERWLVDCLRGDVFSEPMQYAARLRLESVRAALKLAKKPA